MMMLGQLRYGRSQHSRGIFGMRPRDHAELHAHEAGPARLQNFSSPSGQP
jgi:hypothetical protein